jgi:hypothetical protein
MGFRLQSNIFYQVIDYMKKTLTVTLLLFFVIFAASSLFAGGQRNKFHSNQVGVWFGPISPLGFTDDYLDSNLGGGVFMRFQLPWEILKLGFDVSYQEYTSTGVINLKTVPIRFEALFWLPFKKIPVNIQVKVGAGASYIYAFPRNTHTVDPLFLVGFELSFPAGRVVNIGARVEYMYFLEAHIKPTALGAHFLNVGVSIYFNI